MIIKEGIQLALRQGQPVSAGSVTVTFTGVCQVSSSITTISVRLTQFNTHLDYQTFINGEIHPLLRNSGNRVVCMCLYLYHHLTISHTVAP